MKTCIKCNKTKNRDRFNKNNKTKDLLQNICKECKQNYYKKNRNKLLESASVYYKLNKDRSYKQEVKRHINAPWKRTKKCIENRCNNKNNISYKYYGGRGIKCKITEEELKELWFRDNASSMKKPSIDRIDNDGHYEYDNCQFLENEANSNKSHYVPILQYSLDGVFIKEWKSQIFASKELKIDVTSIWNVLNKRRNTAGGFKWKYNNDTK